ncbi:germacradienol/geosmin synthase, partial [Streptomyces sp. NPDC059627]
LDVHNFSRYDNPPPTHLLHALSTPRLQQFEHVLAGEPPVWYHDFELSAEERAATDAYVRDLQNWMAGILNWHRHVDRYKADHLARRAHGFLPDRPPLAPALPVA